MKRILFIHTLTFLLLLACTGSKRADAQGQVQIEIAFPALSFTRPVDLQSPPDGTNRLFVVEQSGRIYGFENSASANQKTLFLDLTERVNDAGNEEGLLGLAFHPGYRDNGYFYVNYTAANPARTVIARFQVSAGDSNLADPSTELVLLEVAQPYSNHNGGQIAFGPDGYFYIALGDGGSGGDPLGHGQNLKTLLGAILRIDVDQKQSGLNYGIPEDNPFVGNSLGYQEEIYAYGLRNPWRFSFDPVTKWLWAADVGQNRIEEIDIIENGKNYGWNVMEGSQCFRPATGCNTTGLVLPIWEYTHALGASVTGGYVYRGTQVPALVGAYIYGDFISGRIWALRYDSQTPPVNAEILATDLRIASFGVDQAQELYLCAFDGKIYRFKSVTSVADRSEQQPVSFRLGQNYPNPFNAGTTIPYELLQAKSAQMRIYDRLGQLVRFYPLPQLAGGQQRLRWDGRSQNGKSLASGTYFYQLNVGDEKSFLKQMTLVR